MTNWLTDTLGLSSSAQARLLVSLVTVVSLVVARFVVLRTVQRTIEDASVWFRARKAISYLTFLVGALILGRVWLTGFTEVATYLGILSAGIAIALSDVLKNLAGWAFIMLRRPFRIGDRIEIGGEAGDVIDIRVFRFSLLEIRNWVDADQSTGRIIHVPNGRLFTESMANFTEGFNYVWHEVPVLVTFESDWRKAEELVRSAITAHTPDTHEMMAAQDIRKASQQYLIRYTHLTPTVYVTTRDSGVLLTGRLLVPVRQRRGTEDAVWRDLLTAIAAEPTVELAYPTVRTFLQDAIRVERSV